MMCKGADKRLVVANPRNLALQLQGESDAGVMQATPSCAIYYGQLLNET